MNLTFTGSKRSWYFCVFFEIFFRILLVVKSICIIFAVKMERVNPYRVEAQKLKRRVRLVAVTQNPIDVVNVATGEVQRATPYVGNRAWRDISDFVKLYDVQGLLRLKPYEWKVFMVALSELGFDGRFEFSEERYAEKIGCKRGLVYKGVRGLVEKDFIRRDKKGVYWVNPNVAFRGSRDELLF